jgi:hypothetical protein
MDFHSDRMAGETADKFEYTEKGKARWLSPSGSQVGTCVCRAAMCTCDGAFPSKPHDSAIHRTMDFANGDLAITESGFLQSTTFENRYQLKKK